MCVALYVGEGGSLQEAAAICQHIQKAVNHGYHKGLAEAGMDVAGPGEQQPPDNPGGFTEGNPFDPNAQ